MRPDRRQWRAEVTFGNVGAEGLMTLVAVNNDAHLRVSFWKTMIHTINSVVQ